MQPLDLENNQDAQAIKNLMSNLPTAPAEILNNEQYEDAANVLANAKQLQKQAETVRKELTTPIEKEKKRIIAWFKESFDTPLSKTISGLTTMLTQYRRKIEAEQQAEMRKAEEAAEKERRRKEDLARKAEQRGDHAKAAEHLDAADTVVAHVPQTSVPQVDGLSHRENWQFQILQADKLPREYLKPDEAKIRKVVKALKSDTNIPGIRVWDEGTIASTGT